MNRIKKTLVAALGFGLAATVIVACQKEAPLNGDPAPTESLGMAKAPNPLFRMDNGTGTKNFGVQIGCNGCYGLIQNPTVTDQTMHLVSETGGAIYVQGFTDPQCTNVTNCRLDRSTSSTTYWYYIVPNQGPAMGTRKILKLAVKSGVPNMTPLSAPKFVYNVTENVWAWASNAGNYFNWSVVTTLPANTCCFPC